MIKKILLENKLILMMKKLKIVGVDILVLWVLMLLVSNRKQIF
jgi:hypothetical protein